MDEQLLFDSSTGFTGKSFWQNWLANLCRILIQSRSYTSMWSKRRPSFSQRRIWSPIFGHINTTFLQVTDDVLCCWRTNCEDCTGEIVGPLFTWTDLNEIALLIKVRGIKCNMIPFSPLIHLLHQHIKHKERKQKNLKWPKFWWWKSL